MKGVELYGRVRYAVQIEGLSHRGAARRFGIDPRTVAKMMKFTAPPGYVRTKPPAKPKLDPFIPVIDRILFDDKSRPRKQQHTAKRIFERLRDEYGFTGGLTIVKDYAPAGVSGLKRCLCRWSIRRDMPRSTLAKPSASSAAWSARSTSSLLTCRTRTPAWWSATPPRRRKPSATATFGHSTSLAASRSRSFMTTPRSPWPAFLATGSGRGRAVSPSCNRTTYSGIVLVGLAKATTRARSRGWSVTRDGTSLSPFQFSRPSKR